MFETLKNAFKVKEIRVKIWWTLLFLLLYRLGCYIPVPGIGSKLISSEDLSKLNYLSIMSMMTGGSLANGTWFAMGISPYINSSIIIQLLTVAIPALETMSKSGEDGRRKINNITRIVAIVLAIIQSIGILLNYGSNLVTTTEGGPSSLKDMLFGQAWLAYIVAVIFYASGTAVTMWIGERITDYGVCNGVSMLIFIGIISSAGLYVTEAIRTIATSGSDAALNKFWQLVGYLIAIIIVFGCIVLVELAERKILVQYAKQVKGRKMYGGQSTVIPIKVNANGVMPLIFAFSLISFPELIITIFWGSNSDFLMKWNMYVGSGSWVYMIILCLLILGFSYFYTTIQFNPEEISRSIQQNGGFIPGYRPGKPTTDYLKRVSNRITLFGAIYLALMALIPSIVFRLIDQSASSVFTATGMLVAVSVALEFNTALESQLMMKNYKGFLK